MPMDVTVRLGGAASYELEHALLVYGDGLRSFATLHKPVESPSGGAPILGPGEPVGGAFLRGLASGLGAGLPVEILPVTVLARTPEVTVWWRPPAPATLFFKLAEGAKGAARLNKLSGRTFPQPGLVFKTMRGGLWVRAVAGDGRPSPGTPLYNAPYYNVDETGGVCLGTMRAPESRGIDALAEWERGFFESEFTHISGRVRPTRYPGGLVALWSDLAQGSRKRASRVFPGRALVRVKTQTLEAFARAGVRDDAAQALDGVAA